MRVPSIAISQSFGQLSIRSDLGGVTIQSSQPKLDVQTEHPQIYINKRQGKLDIDQSKAWSALGKMKINEWRTHVFKQTPGIVNQGIKKTVHKGNMLSDITTSGSAIPHIAKQNGIGMHQLKYHTKPAYKHVQFSYFPEEQNINFDGAINIRHIIEKPVINRIPAQVDIGLLRYPSIQIDWVDSQINRTL